MMKKYLASLVLSALVSLGVQAKDSAPFRIAYFDNYAPYSWRDDDGKMRGVFIDIVDEVIGKRMNQPVRHEGFPWARAQNNVRTGAFDAMIAPQTRQRQEYANISRVPVLNSRMAVFTHAAHPRMAQLESTRSLGDLESFDFVTQLGDGWARENLDSQRVQYVSDLDTVLRMLSQARADLFIEASLVTHWNLKNLGLEQRVTEVDGVTIEVTPYYLMVSKLSQRQIGEQFDREMRAFMHSDAFQELLATYK